MWLWGVGFLKFLNNRKKNAHKCAQRRAIYSKTRAKGAEMTRKDTKMQTRRRYCGAGKIMGGPDGCLARILRKILTTPICMGAGEGTKDTKKKYQVFLF